MKKYLLVFSLLFLAGCSSTPDVSTSVPSTKTENIPDYFSTSVSSIKDANIPDRASFYVLLHHLTIESKKIARSIRNEMVSRDYQPGSPDTADIIVAFQAGLTESNTETLSSILPINNRFYLLTPGTTTSQTTGYKTQVDSATKHHIEIQLQLYEGNRLRDKHPRPELWDGVGKREGTTLDIIALADEIVWAIFQELGHDSDSVLHRKVSEH